MAVDQPKPADSARAADDGPSGIAPAEPAKPGATAQPSSAAAPGAAGKSDGTAASDLDDMKRKFREALDRKRGSHAAANAEGAQDTGKVHGSHGPAASRRSFRRKSGG
jgi:hypothetical protein